MNAVDVKIEIEKKLDKISQTMAFCCGKKYEEIIKNKIDKMPFYIYDNTDYQIERLEEIELYDIAIQFSKDISDNLDCNEEKKIEIQKEIANILKLSINEVGISDNYLKKVISSIEELNKDEFFDLIVKEIELYKDDYKVKDIVNKINIANDNKRNFISEIYKLKKSLFVKQFKVSRDIGDSEIDKLWELLKYFEPINDNINSIEYSELSNAFKKEFYRLIGCIGETVEELEENAKKKGIFVSNTKYKNFIMLYSELFYEIAKEYFKYTSNLNEIFTDLEDKGYLFDKKIITRFFLETSTILGASFGAVNKDKKEGNIVIYNHNSKVYSKDFNETVIHEIIHYIGGNNLNLNKVGLFYNNDSRYCNLEEAYTNFLAKEINEKFTSENGDIISARIFDTHPCVFDCTLEYMEVVFKLYREELIYIHLQDDIDVIDANKICPLDTIANSVTRIVDNDNFYKIKEITKQEINKLKRLNKR